MRSEFVSRKNKSAFIISNRIDKCIPVNIFQIQLGGSNARWKRDMEKSGLSTPFLIIGVSTDSGTTHRRSFELSATIMEKWKDKIGRAIVMPSLTDRGQEGRGKKRQKKVSSND